MNFPLSLCGLAMLSAGALPAQLIIRQAPESDRAFDEYLKTAEAKFDWRAHIPFDKPGVAVVISGGPKPAVDAPAAIIHDWAGAVMVPGATVRKALTVLESYDDYKRVYAPQVTDSKVISHDGNRWRVYLKLHKPAIIPANLATEYDVEYRPLAEGRWAMLSRSTKVAELDGGRELPAGTGHGFLWRLNAYWTLEQRREGVYLECRSISMSRDIPPGLGWAIKPYVTTLPRESLRQTLEATARALK